MEWLSVEVRYFMQYGKSQTGLTMVEIMIYIAISSMMMASVYNAGVHTLERFNVTKGVWEAVAGNVDALNFVYLKQDGTRATVPQDIQYIEIALLVRSRNAEPKFINTTTYHNKQGDVLCASCT